MPQPELYQCPYEAACKCCMTEPCKGCETWAEAIRKQEDLKHASGSQSAVDGGVSWRAFLIKYANNKYEQSKRLASTAKRDGKTQEEVAWNHSAMAYADIVREIVKAQDN